MNSIGILWVQYGPYHLARLAALKKLAGSTQVHALEFSNQTSVYAWDRAEVPAELITLCSGTVAEKLSFLQVFRQARRTFAKLNLEVCLLPSYAPRQSLAALLAAKSLGIRTVMMNESHAGTARAGRMGTWIKRQLVGLFDTALVGGQPQKRYAVSLGLPPEKNFTGYDSVDNHFFAGKAAEICRRDSDFRNQYDLPDHYFLSLGRFVVKKNLDTLIRAYRKFLDCNPQAQTHLVMVGSGEEVSKLRTLCGELRLPVYDKTQIHNREGEMAERQLPIVNETPGVHFYGFRQIEENPIFYALADAFILPSLYEEWGLVVNEAMACGLPVIVSETAGCAEDLLVPDRLAVPPEASPALRMNLAHLTGRIRQNGFLFNPASVHQLAAALLVLEAAPVIRENMGQASRRIVEAFSCENFAVNALRAAQAAMGGPQLNVSDREPTIGNLPLKV